MTGSALYELTRRGCLELLSSVGIAGSLAGSGESDATSQGVTVEKCLIPPASIPAEFEVRESSDMVPVLDTLRPADPWFESADAAVNGYVVRDGLVDPEWVLASVTVCGEEPLPRKTVESVTTNTISKQARDYRAIDECDVRCEQTRRTRSELSEWQLDVSIAQVLPGEQVTVAAAEFTDILRFQYCDEVLLGTVVFGPQDADRSVMGMVDRFAELQRSRLADARQHPVEVR